MNDIVLLPRFFQQVHLHLVTNYLNLPVRPVVLGVFGRTGDGKSAQLITALEHCHVEILRINAADLESGLAGEPGKLVARTYAAASLAINKGSPIALVVDDVDTTIGEWELNTGTVNHQQILAELMHIADRPVDPNRNRPRRVPIFVTGNNLSRLYPPLRRHGRMSVLEWRPTRAEVCEVVNKLFDEFAQDGALDTLVQEFGDEPLAFFADVRHAMLEAQLLERLERSVTDMRALLRASATHRDRLSHYAAKLPNGDLLATAREVRVRRAAALRDFLHEPGADKEESGAGKEEPQVQKYPSPCCNFCTGGRKA